ncbi:MAG: phospho-sugar mutase [Spirochaetales bacterium]|nr:phospho-sugar mutase [Spirochaetales bacterium]
MDDAAILKRAEEYIQYEKDKGFRSEVETLLKQGCTPELRDRFYTDLEFGTGGLRGIIGGGYNRMNSFIVQRATQGLANYIAKTTAVGSHSVVIAYDSRRYSDVFAMDVARVLAGNGIKAYLFSELRPTPELSFAVRFLKATAGIVVTASHNPKEYNGYKVYWSDGAQVLPPHDKGIIREVKAVTGDIRIMEREEGLSSGRIKMILEEIDTAFLDMVEKTSLRPDLVRKSGNRLKVVYTPLCGAGAWPVEAALARLGIDVTWVPEEKNPDPVFAGLKYPNPEEASAMARALELAASESADLVFGTDPDADRIGIAVPDREGYRLVTGNQLGVLLMDYILSSRKELNRLPGKSVVIKTIVTTEMQRLVAGDYGVQCLDVLTGFKYIGEKIRQFEGEKDGPAFIMGDEESYGFLLETDVRDKDAVSAAAMCCEMALYYLANGKTLLDRLYELYSRHGFFKERLITRLFPGETGHKQMSGLLETLRNNPPAEFAGQKTVMIRDYSDGTVLNMQSGSRNREIDLPSSNVLQFVLSDHTVISVRPSGTEPKIKFYLSARSDKGLELKQAEAVVDAKLSAIGGEIEALIGSVNN